MTLAPPHRTTDAGSAPHPGSSQSSHAGAAPGAETTGVAAAVTAVLVLRGPASALPQTLDSLARQTRLPDRLLVVDPGLDGNAVEVVRAHRALADAVPDAAYVSVADAATLTEAVRAALAQVGEHAAAAGGEHRSVAGETPAVPDDTATVADETPAVEHLWVLTCDSAAAPTTLARLLDAVRRSPSVGAAGPKLLDWTVPGALRSVGVQLTRSGRVIPSPAPGEPDQGQYDRRSDVLAVPATGMLVERAVFDGLRGPDRAFGDFGADVDFSWRAQQAGHRVVVVPRATVCTGAPLGDDDRSPSGSGDTATRMRRQARRVALARCAWWALPFLAVWVALTSLAAALALLVAKRPRAAWAELSDLGAVLTPGRVLGARWRSRGTRRVRRRDLAGLFVPASTVLRHTGDLVHDQVAFDDGRVLETTTEVVEAGPVPDEAQDLHVLGSTWLSRAARNPGLLAFLLATVTALVATRSMGGGLFERLGSGVVGGELLGGRATTGSTWHLWLDGWHGAGLGQSGEQGPHLVVLSALAWLVTHLPVVGAPASPVGSAVALLVTLAVPASTLAAYLGARVITHSRWPRALVALAWGSTAVLTSATATGRLGGLVTGMLLPLVAAGFALAARRGGSTTVTAATVLATAVLGAFVPAFLPLAALAAVLVVVLGRGGARLRGLALLVGPALLLGPWVQTLVERPMLLLAGPGLTVWGADQALPWQLVLLHPGGPGSYPVLLSAPVVLAGVLGLLRAGRRGWTATVLSFTGLLGLAYALLAPRLVLATVPAGSPDAGASVTAWSGTGLALLALSLLAAALLGADGLAVSRARGGWVALTRWPVAAALIVAVVAGIGWTSWKTLGDTLGTWTDPRPAVAVDQAESGVGNRMLLLQPEGTGLSFDLLGREPSDLARSLPPTAADRPDETALATAVGQLFQQGAAPGELDPAKALSDLAVGFVGLRTDDTDPRIRALDATAGLGRLGQHDGVTFWRVLPGGSRADDGSLAPSRIRLVTARSAQALSVDGDHGRLVTRAVVPQGASLVLAEPAGWVRHARVEVDGHVVAPADEGVAYPVPAGAHTLTVEVLPSDATWRWAQGLALLLVVFLAIPFGNRASRRRS
ncbi:glycosyltransferase [Phycicoccus sp. Soil748]|uniref:glycosyltransferase n=1 Tax=Phycicoccus sp. Soil748 TaxID=1736397 RepID=UPI0007039F9C|nr:glycosyltransferase [Phycicoccus sp. Soil748]KRE57140.1 hypothetical protein ASG70_01555 [Phycicoccus sp. Soil748]